MIATIAIFVAISAFAADPLRPDPILTPGKINPAITDVCSVTWGRDARHVDLRLRKQVFAEYNIDWARHSEFEVDHLISRELGGADDILNLWPQPWEGPYGARAKDRLENKLHSLVCSGQLSLHDAQERIRADWIVTYDELFR